MHRAAAAGKIHYWPEPGYTVCGVRSGLHGEAWVRAHPGRLESIV